MSAIKKQLKRKLKDYLRIALLQERDILSISQEEMATRLLMSPRAYANLESGRSCCSFITMLLFLTRCCVDRIAFIDGLMRILEVTDFQDI